MAMILYTLVMATTITFLLGWGWKTLCFALLREKPKLNRTVLFFTEYIALQILFNFLLMYTPLAEHLYVAELVTNTLQAGLMVVIFTWGTRRRPVQVLCAVALSYFIIHIFMTATAELAFPLVLPLILAQEPASFAFFAAYALYDLACYVPVVLYAYLVRFLLGKTRFAIFFKSLFSTKIRAAVTAALCLVMMHSTRIITIVAPSLFEAAWFIPLLFVIDTGVLLALLFVAVFETHRQRLQAQDTLLLQQQAYVNTLERLQGEVRAYRHDQQNLLSGLYLQAAEGDLEGVKAAVKSTLNYFDENIGGEIKQAAQLANIGPVELKSLVLVKLMELQKRGIKARLEVPHPVHTVHMETEDLLRCLGILLDNAMEAAADCRPAFVGLAMLQEQTDLSLIVSNPTPAPPQLHRLGEKGYSTKGTGRGVGLASLRSITGHYTAAALKTVYENGVLRQELRIRRG